MTAVRTLLQQRMLECTALLHCALAVAAYILLPFHHSCSACPHARTSPPRCRWPAGSPGRCAPQREAGGGACAAHSWNVATGGNDERQGGRLATECHAPKEAAHAPPLHAQRTCLGQHLQQAHGDVAVREGQPLQQEAPGGGGVHRNTASKQRGLQAACIAAAQHPPPAPQRQAACSTGFAGRSRLTVCSPRRACRCPSAPGRMSRSA